MLRRFERSIDRELGPAAQEQEGAPARDPWLRDWPMLLGLVVSAALIAGSTSIAGSEARPDGPKAPKSATAAAGADPGEVVDVGEPEAEQPRAEPVPEKQATKKAKRSQSKRKGATAEPTATAEPEADSPSSGGSSTPGKRTTRRSSGSASHSAPAKPGRIVNVTGTSVAFTNGPLSYSLRAPTHTPTVGEGWRLSLTAAKSGTPLAGSVKIDILHNGSVVGHVTTGKLKNGRFAHDFDWPEQSVGHPLTVKTTVVGGGFQQSFLFNVKVKSGR